MSCRATCPRTLVWADMFQPTIWKRRIGWGFPTLALNENEEGITVIKLVHLVINTNSMAQNNTNKAQTAQYISAIKLNKNTIANMQNMQVVKWWNTRNHSPKALLGRNVFADPAESHKHCLENQVYTLCFFSLSNQAWSKAIAIYLALSAAWKQ